LVGAERSNAGSGVVVATLVGAERSNAGSGVETTRIRARVSAGEAEERVVI